MSVPTLSAADYKVMADGTTDDTAAWNSAIAALKKAGGGILLAPVGTSLISATLSLDFNGARIVGMGRGAYHDLGTGPTIGPAASTLMWHGAGGGVMMAVGPDAGASSGLSDWEVSGIHLDSGYFAYGASAAAGSGLVVASASHGRADIFCTEFATQGLLMTTTSGATESGNSSYNRISFRGRQINMTGGVLCRFNGASGRTNSCFNRIARIAGEFAGSIGLDLHDCDNNTFEEVYLQAVGSGAGDAVVFNGGGGANSGQPGPARNNTIEHLSTSTAGTQILAIGTDGGAAQPSGPNRIEQYDQGNASPNIAVGTGAVLYYGTNATPPGLRAHSDGQYGGYRTSEDGFSVAWGSTGSLAAGSSNAISFPSGLFRKFVVGATATPLGSVANSFAINDAGISGMTIVVGAEAAYFTWRAEGF